MVCAAHASAKDMKFHPKEGWFSTCPWNPRCPAHCRRPCVGNLRARLLVASLLGSLFALGACGGEPQESPPGRQVSRTGGPNPV
jgi:hypothetical protein